MDTPENSPVRCVLILKADRLYAEALRHQTLRLYPRARVPIALTVDAAKAILAVEKVDVFVTGVGASFECDVLDLISGLSQKAPNRGPRVLVVTVRREYRVLVALRTLGVDGVFDSATESPSAYVSTLKAIWS